MIFIVEFLKNKHTHNSLLSKDKLFLENEGMPRLPLPDKIVSALFCKVD